MNTYELTIPAPGQSVAVAHGLGITPAIIVSMVCQSAKDGFMAGDSVLLQEPFCFDTEMTVFSAIADSDIVTVAADNYDSFSLIPRSGGQRIQQDSTNWRIKVCVVG